MQLQAFVLGCKFLPLSESAQFLNWSKVDTVLFCCQSCLKCTSIANKFTKEIINACFLIGLSHCLHKSHKVNAIYKSHFVNAIYFLLVTLPTPNMDAILRNVNKF